MKKIKNIKKNTIALLGEDNLFLDICNIWDIARNHVARSVNSTHSISSWLSGWRIVEFEQAGKNRAEYYKTILENISIRLTQKYGSGFSVSGLQYMRSFYLLYPKFLSIQHAVRVKSKKIQLSQNEIELIMKAPSEETCKPGIQHSNLSWTHYRVLLKVKRIEVRNFYKIEAIKSGWPARELERQINSPILQQLVEEIPST